jgi:mono/diheme cytochrome c family protein
MPAMTRRYRVLAAGALLLGSGACTPMDNALAAVPIFAFLRSAPSFDPYEHPLPAPPGSVPYSSPTGEIMAPLEASEAALNAFAATPNGQNPLSPDDAAALAHGQVMFERNCAVCHGTQGAGNGPLAGPGKFPFVPSLVSGSALSRADGYIYGIIRAGRGLMPSYGARISHMERWAIVNYVNQLQAQAGGGAAAPAAPAGAAADSAARTGAVPDSAARQ